MKSIAPVLFYRVAMVALLTLIAVELYRIEARLPAPARTRADLTALSTDEERRRFWMSLPLVTVNGQVEVEGTVGLKDNTVQLREPIAVTIQR